MSHLTPKGAILPKPPIRSITSLVLGARPYFYGIHLLKLLLSHSYQWNIIIELNWVFKLCLPSSIWLQGREKVRWKMWDFPTILLILAELYPKVVQEGPYIEYRPKTVWFTLGSGPNVRCTYHVTPLLFYRYLATSSTRSRDWIDLKWFWNSVQFHHHLLLYYNSRRSRKVLINLSVIRLDAVKTFMVLPRATQADNGEGRRFRLGLSSVVNRHSFSRKWNSLFPSTQSIDDDGWWNRSIDRLPLCDFSSRLSTDGRFRYRQWGIFLTSFIMVVGLASSMQFPVALLSSPPVKFHDHSEKNNSEEWINRRATGKLVLATPAHDCIVKNSNQPHVPTTLVVLIADY